MTEIKERKNRRKIEGMKGGGKKERKREGTIEGIKKERWEEREKKERKRKKDRKPFKKPNRNVSLQNYLLISGNINFSVVMTQTTCCLETTNTIQLIITGKWRI